MARSKPRKKPEQNKPNAELTEAEWVIMKVVWGKRALCSWDCSGGLDQQ